MNRISLSFRFTFLALALMGSIVLLSLAPAPLYGQVSSGSIQGTVKDSSGAVVSGATVTAVNADTQFTRTDATNTSGLFSFIALPIGQYKLTVQSKGFSTYSESIQVTVGSHLEREVSLSVGATATTVEVLGTDVAVVNTINQEVSSVVSSAEVAQLPTLTRNPYDLVATAGNAQQDSQAGYGDARGAGFALNGQRSASTSILLDGAENVDLFTAAVGQSVPLDSVQEFRVISNGMTAEYGRAAGGVVNVATKSGTNQFHGSAYEFNRVAKLASNTYYNAANDTAKAGFTRNQFGYSIGGPIKKNKLFFFNSTEWIRVRSSAPWTTAVPNPAFIAAANSNTQNFFSTYGNLRSDLKSTATVTVNDLYNSLTDPISLVNSAGPLLKALNTASPGMAAFNVVTYGLPSDAGGGLPQNTLMTVGRVDFNISDKTQLFGRYSYYNETDFAGTIVTSPYVGYETGQTNKDNNFLLSLTHSFTSNLLSNSRIVFTRLNGPVQPLGKAAIGPTLYMSNAYTARVRGARVAFPGYSEYTPGNSIPFGGPQNLIQAYQDLSWVHGKHTFRFGGQYIYTQDNRMFGAYEAAVESLGSNYSKSYEGFLGGTLNTFQAAVNPQGKFPCTYDSTGVEIKTADCTVTLPVSAPSFSRSNLYNDLAFYGQDSWKVSSRLTLDLGLRWEYYGVQHNKNQNLDSNFYYGTGSNIFDQLRSGSVQVAPKSSVGSLWAPQKRISVPAWALPMMSSETARLRCVAVSASLTNATSAMSPLMLSRTHPHTRCCRLRRQT
jgi:outer membrane receptor protein involved in Fe transport